MNSRNQSYVIYLLLFVAIIAMLVYNFSAQSGGQETVTINQVAEEIKKGNITKIVGDEDRLTITYKDGTQSRSNKENSATLIEQLVQLGVKPEQLNPEQIKLEIKPPSAWLGVLTAFF